MYIYICIYMYISIYIYIYMYAKRNCLCGEKDIVSMGRETLSLWAERHCIVSVARETLGILRPTKKNDGDELDTF